MTTINQSELDNSVYFGMHRQQAGHVFVPDLTLAVINQSTITNIASDPVARTIGIFNGGTTPIGVRVDLFTDFSQFDASVNPAAASITRRIIIEYGDTTVPTTTRNLFSLRDGVQGLPGVIQNTVNATLNVIAPPSGTKLLNALFAQIPYGELSVDSVSYIVTPGNAIYVFCQSASTLSTQAVGESAIVAAHVRFVVDDLLFP